MHQAELLELIKVFDASGLSKLHWEQDEENIELEKNSTVLHTTPARMIATLEENSSGVIPQSYIEKPQLKETGIPVKAPLVGVMYCAPTPGSAPFVKEGQSVKKGDVLCIIEAMKMMNELLSPIDGTVTRIHAQNEEVVAFDQVLFEVTPC